MTIVVHVDGMFAVEERQGVCAVWQGLETTGSDLEPGRVSLVFGVFVRAGLGEGGVGGFPADIP